mgnify:CR=1 FL=1
MFRLKLFSFMTKDSGGSLFEISFGSNSGPTRVGGPRPIGFGSGTQRPSPRPNRRRQLVLNVLDIVFPEEKP